MSHEAVSDAGVGAGGGGVEEGVLRSGCRWPARCRGSRCVARTNPTAHTSARRHDLDERAEDAHRVTARRQRKLRASLKVIWSMALSASATVGWIRRGSVDSGDAEYAVSTVLSLGTPMTRRSPWMLWSSRWAVTMTVSPAAARKSRPHKGPTAGSVRSGDRVCAQVCAEHGRGVEVEFAGEAYETGVGPWPGRRHRRSGWAGEVGLRCSR